ncbi:MAG: hypothetical protein OXU20_09065 [Myxococcales bacterium]|nr:hypothetical protein [Myxococcales bacterium]MDD9971195.1 hypothetical protein [Myxococcales bacterium]
MPLEHKLVAVTHALLGCLILVGIWLALPARHLPVDLTGTAAGVGALASSLALGSRRPWAPRFARLLCWGLLAIGAALSTALAWTAAHLAGLYGPVGSGGALLMGTIGVLVAPYLVGLPVLQLSWLRRR